MFRNHFGLGNSLKKSFLGPKLDFLTCEPGNTETQSILGTWEPGNTEAPSILGTWEPGNTEEPSILGTWEPGTDVLWVSELILWVYRGAAGTGGRDGWPGRAAGTGGRNGRPG